jgi:hypothetical protein
MSLTYLQRRAVVESVLAAERAQPADGKTLSDLAATVLRALDCVKENVR